MSATIVVDTDALVALFYDRDAHAEVALKLLQNLMTKRVRLLYPATTIAETITVFQRKYAHPHITAQIVQLLHEGHFRIEPVTAEVIAEAQTLFAPHGSKHNTFFDAIVAAIARHENAAAIFSFDGWYTKQGFRLVSEMESL